MTKRLRLLGGRTIEMFGGTTYYVDATGGNDSNSGLSPAEAWQTEDAINSSSVLVYGDKVLFKRGETWSLTTRITVPCSGLIFGTYGSGSNPIIDGQDTVDCFYANGKIGIIFKKLEATQGLDSGFHFEACSNIYVIDCNSHDAGNDNLIFIAGCKDSLVLRGKFYSAYERTPTTQVSGIEISDDSLNIIVDGSECYSQVDGGHGITVHSHSDTSMPNRIEIKNCILHNNAGYGIQVLKQDNTIDTDNEILIHDNNMYSNTLDGIRVYKSAGATSYPNGVKVYLNYSRLNTQYAYYFSGINLLAYRNKLSGRGFLTACQSSKFVNNTMYFTVGAGLYPCYINDANTSGIEVKNNIVNATVAGGMMIGVDSAVTGSVSIDYNLWYLAAEGVGNTRWYWKGTAYNYTNWLTNSGQDSNDPTADQNPLLNDPANGDYTLQAGSPAIDVGVVIPSITDGYLGTAPDCGYIETA